MKSFIVALLLLLPWSVLTAQTTGKSKMDHQRKVGQSNIDSLRSELRHELNEGNDTVIYDLVGQMYLHYNTSGEWDSLRKYANLTSDYALKTGDIEIHLKTIIGLIYTDKLVNADYSQIEERLAYLRTFYDRDDVSQRRKGEICEAWAMGLMRRGLIDSVIVVQKMAVDHLSKVEDHPDFVFQARLQLGVYLQTNRQFVDALDLLLESERQLEDANLPAFAKYNFMKSIGQVLYKISDYPKAIEYFEKALKIAEAEGYKSSQYKARLSIGRCNHLAGNKSKALDQLEAASKYFATKENKSWKVEADLYLSEYYRDLDDAANERRYLDSIKVVIGDGAEKYRGVSYQYFDNSANLHLRQGNIAKAKSDFEMLKRNGLEEGSPTGGVDKLEYLIAKAEGRYDDALVHMEHYKTQRDSVNKASQTMKARRLESQFKRKEQDAEILSLNKVTTAQEKSLAVRNTALVLGSIMLFILAGLLLGLYRLFVKYRANQEELSKQNLAISKALEDNQMLIREIHHRVKNNLQVVSSLLSMQARKVTDDDTKDALNSSKTRVQSMSILHQNLYQEDNLKDVDVASYVDKLIGNIIDTYHVNENIKVQIDVDPIVLDIDTLVPLGLMANELVCNAVKHAFKGREAGELNISLKDIGESIVLTVSDDGVGFEGEELPIRAGSLGARLIKSFADRLEGEINIVKDSGTSVVITFDKSTLLTLA